MKTIENRINEIIKTASMPGSGIFDNDTIERLVISAYYMGFEKAVKETSDRYNDILSEQIERANNERYHNLAMRVQGDIKYLYSPDYAEPTKNELIKDLETRF